MKRCEIARSKLPANGTSPDRPILRDECVRHARSNMGYASNATGGGGRSVSRSCRIAAAS